MIVVGVDGGGTRSRALVVDAAQESLGAADGGAGIILPEDPLAAARAVEEVVRAAAGEASVPLPLDALWAGLAGARRQAPTERVVTRLREVGVAKLVEVGTDVEAAHADAFRVGPGVLLVLGTGSVTYAVDPTGQRITVGGWGIELGDEASGYRIGMDALQAIIRGYDGREVVTGLTGTLLGALGLREPPDLLDWTGIASKGDIAAVSPLVVQAGRGGDVVASRIVHRALGEVRGMLDAALRRTSGWPGPPGLALVGGLLRGENELRPAVREIGTELGFEVLEAVVMPERGAALRALELAGSARP